MGKDQARDKKIDQHGRDTYGYKVIDRTDIWRRNSRDQEQLRYILHKMLRASAVYERERKWKKDERYVFNVRKSEFEPDINKIGQETDRARDDHAQSKPESS